MYSGKLGMSLLTIKGGQNQCTMLNASANEIAIILIYNAKSFDKTQSKPVWDFDAAKCSVKRW